MWTAFLIVAAISPMGPARFMVTDDLSPYPTKQECEARTTEMKAFTPRILAASGMVMVSATEHCIVKGGTGA